MAPVAVERLRDAVMANSVRVIGDKRRRRPAGEAPLLPPLAVRDLHYRRDNAVHVRSLPEIPRLRLERCRYRAVGGDKNKVNLAAAKTLGHGRATIIRQRGGLARK